MSCLELLGRRVRVNRQFPVFYRLRSAYTGIQSNGSSDVPVPILFCSILRKYQQQQQQQKHRGSVRVAWCVCVCVCVCVLCACVRV